MRRMSYAAQRSACISARASGGRLGTDAASVSAARSCEYRGSLSVCHGSYTEPSSMNDPIHSNEGYNGSIARSPGSMRVTM